jgi:hypothetical protein
MTKSEKTTANYGKKIEWIYKPTGNCPVQSEGYFMGYFFYFRARHRHATIEFYNKKDDFYVNFLTDPITVIILKTTDEYKAGWLSKKECRCLILEGCTQFSNMLKNAIEHENKHIPAKG